MMKNILRISIVLLAGTVWAGTYNGGLGTEAKPYKISNVGNWQELMRTPSDWDKYFVLTNNLIFVMGADLVPVGNTSKQFSGVVDGQGYSFKGAMIDQPEDEYVGLFGYVGHGGQIKNLGVNIKVNGKIYVGGLAGFNHGTLTNCFATGSVRGTDSRIGGLVGYNYDGILTDCYATSSVSGPSDVGGLVGLNGGSLISCYATGSVSGTEDLVGGLMGYNSHGVLISCYATGSVIGAGRNTGGLLGINDTGTLTVCYATGMVTGTGDNVGGLVGWNSEGTLSACYALNTVTGTVETGGLVGYNRNSMLIQCFATGAIQGTIFVGGLVGGNSASTITDSYAIGSVSGTRGIGGVVGLNTEASTLTNCCAVGSISGSEAIGGVVGYNHSVIVSCFWDTQTTNLIDGVGNEDPDPTGVMGKTTFEMKKQSTFTPAGWDFVDVWGIVDNQTYPYLRIRLTADLNGDGIVDLADFTIFASQWLRQ